MHSYPSCPVCGGAFAGLTYPIHCCGQRHELPPLASDATRESHIDHRINEGSRKMEICRSNRCGRYDATTDTCQILTAMGRRGAIEYLERHPETACVADPPLYGRKLDP